MCSPFFGTDALLYSKQENDREVHYMEYSIVWVRGHVEVYDGEGKFFFSADNEREAREELREMAA